jgi:hypothetical protein
VLGDDRAIAGTWLRGRKWQGKPGLGGAD